MFFKKKADKKRNSCKIHFKHNPNAKNIAKRNKKKFPIKKSSAKPSKRTCNPRVKKIKQIKRRNTILALFFCAFLLSLALFTAYSIINFITGIRGGTSIDDIIYEQSYVKEISSVPVYPGSEFAYMNREDEEIVLRMLNQGLSVYKLPRRTKTSDVYEYYEEKLPLYEWELLSMIPMSTEEKLLGQYWLKDEKGLRIHVENNDVWYELLTKTEAQNALKERRYAEIQRKRILETSSEQSLLPDYPWILQIPREYLTHYSSTDIGELQSVEIYEIGGDARFIIYPIGKSNSDSYDQMLQDFLEKQSEELDQDWSIINIRQDYKKEREVLSAKLIVNGEKGEGIVLMNQRNFIVYTIISNKLDDPFFEEIINEIHEP